MIIRDVKVNLLKIPLKTTFKTSLRTVSSLETVVVCIISDGGIGYGEAPPIEAITGETIISIVDAITNYIKPNIIGKDINNLSVLHEIIKNSINGNSSAKAAVEIGIYDLYSQFYKSPLYSILNKNNEIKNKNLTTDITISVNKIDEMIIDCNKVVDKGFSILKVKLGKNGIRDLDIIKSIYENVGEETLIRIDANQGWNVKDSIIIIEELGKLDFNIDFIEQPVPKYDLEGLKTITANSKYPIVADESFFSIHDAIKIIDNKVANILNIKLMKTGGIYNAIKICEYARDNNIECMIGCMLESKIGVTAAAHIAMSQNNITRIDLDSPLLCRTDPIYGGIEYNVDKIIITNKSGLGIRKINF